MTGTYYYINIFDVCDPDPCLLTNISVAAINGTGIGQTNNISIYLLSKRLVVYMASCICSHIHSVPPSTPTILLIPVINEARRQVSINISINVRERITCLMQTMSECKKIIMHNNRIALYFGGALFW